MFNPLDLAARIQDTVSGSDGRKKYYRFRPSRFYGGIATADCVGCCLECVFCWSWEATRRPAETGRFCTPEDVAAKLLAIAKKKKYKRLRISGSEPTLARSHLEKVLELIPEEYEFILETNGILIGHDVAYAEMLSRFKNLYVRISLKGACEEEFSLLTGAVPEAFQLQFEALKHLVRHGVQTHPACMISFSNDESLLTLRKRLKAIHPAFAEFETEELVLYSNVKERLDRLGVRYRKAYTSDDIPPKQV
jgi:uncharacterized Fe-S cluster-containing radical SAM superfamily protein